MCRNTFVHARLHGIVCLLALPTIGLTSSVRAAEIFVRVRVAEPAGERIKITSGGWRHDGPHEWYLPADKSVEVDAGFWSGWMDLTAWKLSGRSRRVGGIAEWPAMKLTLALAGGGEPIKGCRLEVQLAEKPNESAVVISFTEASESNTIGFLLPHPLREHKGEFETGSQMAARHAAWAKEAMPQDSPPLKKFDLISSLWGPYDPALARQEATTLKRLGFNVIGGLLTPLQRELGLRGYTATWLFEPDPEKADAAWAKGEGAAIRRALETEDGRWTYHNMAHYVVADEIAVISLSGVEPAKVNGWFRAWLRQCGASDGDLPKPISQIEFPAQVTTRGLKALDREADLPQRRLQYYASKFGQHWSVKQLRHTSDLIKSSLPNLRTETLPTDHGFFDAWGPPTVGMSYCLLDLFEIGHQRAVDILSAEDWMGLNHMYGPNYTWTGAQSLEYLSAILRSGIGDEPVALRALITPSDDGYLRLKAYSTLGQGAKSFFFWTYGPTFIGTENYWSDLRSQYDGVARFTRALAKGEDLLYDAKPVRDPVAVLYSVSHDYWHTDDPASFVEKRLTWHALRHLHVQPDFLREEDLEAGRLKDYKVLYVVDQCITRKASAAIDRWVNEGGVVYLAGGAATRDEFYEPYVPAFAQAVWPKNAAAKFIKEKGHRYNERGDLPGIKSMAVAKGHLPATDAFVEWDVKGCRLDLSERLATDQVFARYEDGKPAGAKVTHGKGHVVAVGFLPGVSYSPFKPGQTTLDEVWPSHRRSVFEYPLSIARLDVIARASQSVVETSLLTGPEGSALVLVNYTYQPIKNLRVELKLPRMPAQAVSTEGVEVTLMKTDSGATLELPLDWTDIILLPDR